MKHYIIPMMCIVLCGVCSAAPNGIRCYVYDASGKQIAISDKPVLAPTGGKVIIKDATAPSPTAAEVAKLFSPITPSVKPSESTEDITSLRRDIDILRSAVITLSTGNKLTEEQIGALTTKTGNGTQ